MLLRVVPGCIHFYPRPPRGGRRSLAFTHGTRTEFLSTPSARRATIFAQYAKASSLFLSTPSARRATDDAEIQAKIAEFLSTPSARRATGADKAVNQRLHDFYPRPPRGGRLQSSCLVSLALQFLSTPSARRATKAEPINAQRIEISIHALREEGDKCWCVRASQMSISIHALREEGDAMHRDSVVRCFDFYPRPPRGGRLLRFGQCSGVVVISIHALREEGDFGVVSHGILSCDFYPRPPRGGRPYPSFPQFFSRIFLSTPSARRATLNGRHTPLLIMVFLSTPSARRATRSESASRSSPANFYPRPPRGGRLSSPVKM